MDSFVQHTAARVPALCQGVACSTCSPVSTFQLCNLGHSILLQRASVSISVKWVQ